jgi:hypothetical protein
MHLTLGGLKEVSRRNQLRSPSQGSAGFVTRGADAR